MFAAVEGMRVSEAAGRSGWSPRMLRYLERTGLLVPRRSPSGYRLYGLVPSHQSLEEVFLSLVQVTSDR